MPDAERQIADLRERIEILEEENRQLRAEIRFAGPLPEGWSLSPSEQELMRALMVRPFLSREAAVSAVYGDRDEPENPHECIGVFMSRLRQKLRPRGIEIKTRWGFGFFLPEATRAALRSTAH